MKLIHSLNSIPDEIKKSAITIGVFDGVHIGHAKLIESIKSWARQNGGQSIVVTFKQHPDTFLKKTKDLKYIKSLGDRIRLLSRYAVDYIAVLDFKKVAGMQAEEFVKEILIKKFKMKYIAAGSDFIFGKSGKGNVRFLKSISRKYNFKVNVLGDIKLKKEKISSQAIRHYLKKGDIKKAEHMLGRKYEIEGTVIHGRHIGFKLGFPTANIRIAYEEIPAVGVWAALVNYGNRCFHAAVNIGFSPTLKNEPRPLIEAFLLGFHRNIYGKKLKIRFLEKIRDEKKFRNKEELIMQIRKDIKYIKKNFSCEQWK